jgi:hypothetical protein
MRGCEKEIVGKGLCYKHRPRDTLSNERSQTERRMHRLWWGDLFPHAEKWQESRGESWRIVEMQRGLWPS